MQELKCDIIILCYYIVNKPVFDTEETNACVLFRRKYFLVVHIQNVIITKDFVLRWPSSFIAQLRLNTKGHHPNSFLVCMNILMNTLIMFYIDRKL